MPALTVARNIALPHGRRLARMGVLPTVTASSSTLCAAAFTAPEPRSPSSTRTCSPGTPDAAEVTMSVLSQPVFSAPWFA